MAGEYGSKMRLEIWVDYPHRLANMIGGGDEDAAADALCQIILKHNDWCDEDGNPLPALRPAGAGVRRGSPEFEDMKSAFLDFWDALPQELALAISTAIGVEVSKLMTAVRERRRY